MARCWTSTDGNINYINGDSTPCSGNCAPYPSFALASGSMSGFTGAVYKGSSSAYQVFGEMPSPVYGCRQAQSGFHQIPIAVPRAPFTNGVINLMNAQPELDHRMHREISELYGTSGYASSFTQFTRSNGTSAGWDYGGWHSSAQTTCHQQACAARNTPGRDYDHLQRPHNTDSTGSAGSEDSYWSVRNFPVSNTRPCATQTQPSLHDGTVGDSMGVPQKADYNNMKVRTVLHPVPETHTLECVPSENQSRLCETKWLSPEQQRPEHHDKRSTQQVSATVEVFTPMGSGTLVHQQHDVTKIDHTADPKPIFSKLLEEGVANKEDNEQREQEVQRKREKVPGYHCCILLQLVRLILPWDPGNYSSKIRTKWLPLNSNTTNVNLLLPWDPGEQDLLHVHHMAIILFPLASNGSYVVQWQFLYHEGFSEARTLHGNDFSLVSSSSLKIVQPVPKSEIDLQLLQPAGLMVCTISLYSKAETNLFCTSWAGKFHYVAPATIGIWSGLEKLMCWTQYSFVIYLHTCTLRLVEAVTCLLIALLCKGVQLVFILSTDCCHLRLPELSALMFELFKVCIDNWKGADPLARVFAGNIGETSMRIFAPVLLQAQKYFSLDSSLFFANIVNVLYIATVQVSPNALHEHVQMGRIAKYMHWIQCSDFLNLKAFLMSNDSSLWWFSAYKRAFVQWDPGIVSSDLYARVEMLTAWQNSDMNQVPDPLIGYSCMYIGAEAAVFTLPYSTLGRVAGCGDPDGSLHEHDAYSSGIKLLSFWIAYSFIKNVFCLQLQHQAEKKAPWIVSFRPP